MTSATYSVKLKSLYGTRFLIETAGVLLLIVAAFTLFVAFMTPKGFHGEHGQVIWCGVLTLLIGIGFLLPLLWAKLSSSLLLVGVGASIFHTNAYRWQNLVVYLLFVAPLALTLWLRAGYNDLKIQRLPNGNWLP